MSYKIMLGLQGPRWVQDTVLVRDPKTPEAPGFKLFWKTHDPFPNSSKACCKLLITVLKSWFRCQKE